MDIIAGVFWGFRDFLWGMVAFSRRVDFALLIEVTSDFRPISVW